MKKTVFLLSKGMTTIPTDKGDMRANGRVADCVNRRSDATSDELQQLVESLFGEKLRNIVAIPRFTFMKADRNKVYQPNIPPGTIYDGETLFHLAGKGNVYLMASERIQDGFDEKLYCLDEESSDDNELTTPAIPIITATTSLEPSEPLLPVISHPRIQMGTPHIPAVSIIQAESEIVHVEDGCIETAEDVQLLEDGIPVNIPVPSVRLRRRQIWYRLLQPWMT
ncbi:uncharacterized protein LOC135484791 [Lineus longissimus]|uniref:uncharacterized protein LOC135484791 n=1 Tax=Lineus longissimus TaxID=88925 RepID=UPI00315DC97C